MTTYRWVCFSCQQANAAGQDRCVHCGASALQSGSKIAEAERSRSPDVKIHTNFSAPPPSSESGSREPGLFTGLAILAFCVVCIYGGLVAIWQGHWPGFMPPQLDGLAALLGFISPRFAAILVGLFAVLLGAGGLAAMVFAGGKRNDA